MKRKSAFPGLSRKRAKKIKDFKDLVFVEYECIPTEVVIEKTEKDPNLKPGKTG
jgi:hypothetical protein